MIDNFKKQPERRRSPRALDGFISPQSARRSSHSETKPAPKPVFTDRLQSNQTRRRIGDFNRPEGYQARRGPIAARSSAPRAPQGLTAREQLTASPRRRGANSRKKRSLFFWRKNKVKKTRPRWQRWAMRGSFAVILLVLVFGVFFGSKLLKLNDVFKGGGSAAALDSDISQLKGEGDGRVNILLLGRGGAGHEGADLTDTVLVASIDTINKKAALISVPRDLWVRHDRSSSKLNAVFANAKSQSVRRGANAEKADQAGAKAVESTMENVLGINIHYYSLIDFEGFRQAVDTVGGVTINISEELRDPTMAWENNWNPVLAEAGTQKMDGKQALMYVRSRHGSARGDFDRSERQRAFIMALKNQITAKDTYSNPMKVSQLIDNFGDHAQTDFSLNDLMRLYSLTKGISGFDSIGLADPPHDYLTTDNIGGQSVVVPKAGTFEYGPLQIYLRSQLPDGYILKENTPVTVLNGTTIEGKATEKADELKTYKYNVIGVGNAPTQNYTKTVIVDLTKGKAKYTKNYLEKRFDVKATTRLPEGITAPQKGGFVIIIGSNETVNQ